MGHEAARREVRFRASEHSRVDATKGTMSSAGGLINSVLE